MTTAFYISATNNATETWYMLLVKDTHFCISSGGDLSKILKVLKKYVKRHRTKGRLLKALSELDCGGRVSPRTYEVREEYFQEHGEDYADLVHSTVLEAIHEAKEEDKKNSPLYKVTNRMKKAGGIKPLPLPIKDSPKEDFIPQQDFPKFLTKRPKVFKHK